MLAIEKRPIESPVHSKTGTARLPDYRPPLGPGSSPLERALRRLGRR